MATPKQPSILDSILNGAYNPLGTGAPMPAPLLPAVSSSSGAPTSASPMPSASKGPTLGTEAQFTAPADNAQPTPTADGTWSADRSTLTLPPHTADNSSEPTEDHPGFLKKLGRLAGGATGIEDPNSSPQANMGSKVMDLLGHIGAAGALAVGTPAQKQAVIEQEKIPLQMAQIKNEREYHEGVLGNTANRNDITSKKNVEDEAIKQQLADQQQQKAIGQMRLKLMVPDEKNPGSYRSMTEEEVLADPTASQNRDLVRAAIGSKDAATDLARARADALMNPNNPVLQLKLKEIESRMRLAQAQFGMRVHEQQRQDFQDVQNYGINVNGQTLNNQNAGPFMPTDNQGNPVPNKQAGPFRPTTAARGKGEQANTIMDAGEQLVNDIRAHADQIGPLASRYNDVAAFIGNPPPEFKSLAAELESWIALHPAAHGFRGQNAVKEFQKAFGPIEMTPEALIAGIRGSYNTMGALQRTATPHTTGPKTVPNSSTTVPNSSTPFAEWKAAQQAKNGGK